MSLYSSIFQFFSTLFTPQVSSSGGENTLKVHLGRYSRACPTTPTCICLMTCWRIRALVPWTWSPAGNIT